MIKVNKKVFELGSFKVNALEFIPGEEEGLKPVIGLFSHGYTSHKGSLLNWGSRLAEEGVPCTLFDLPGHYLGGINEVESFEEFKNEAYKLFSTAFTALQNEIPVNSATRVILGGHSLGALLAVKALDLPEFSNLERSALTVGLGLSNLRNGNHVFEAPFYKSTLNLRGQLVSPNLKPKDVFDWIQKEKQNITVSGLKIHMIVGQDDLVVTPEGATHLKEILEKKGNEVTLELPNKLPHHQPELAASHLKKYLKSEGLI